jgi:hypothetical protein
MIKLIITMSLALLAGCEWDPLNGDGMSGGRCYKDRTCMAGLACMTFHRHEANSDNEFFDVERCVARGDVRLGGTVVWVQTKDGGQP